VNGQQHETGTAIVGWAAGLLLIAGFVAMFFDVDLAKYLYGLGIAALGVALRRDLANVWRRLHRASKGK
jgi:hypothetical protein